MSTTAAATVREELVNELSWSVSRARTLDDCARRYYWSYYGSWGGWADDGPEDARLAYRLKRLVTLEMWAGDIVHRVIAETLGGVRDGKPFPTFDDLRERARFILNREWFESRDRAWEEDPKRFRNLMEHYYERGITRDRRIAIRDRIFACLWHFGRSGVLREILSVKQAEDWLLLEELGRFETEAGAPVLARPDLALRVREGESGTERVVIYDWKTGRENEKDRVQVATYALFAQNRWGIAPQNVRVVLFYLRNGIVRAATPAADELEAARAGIDDGIARMRAVLRDPERNEAAMEDFALTSRRRSCERCAFFELCAPELGAS